MSIPLVKGFRDGVVARPSSSACSPPPAIEAFLDRLVPSETDRLIAAGDEEVAPRGRRGGSRGTSGRASPSAASCWPRGGPDEIARGARAGCLRPGRRGAPRPGPPRRRLTSPTSSPGMTALERGDTEQGLDPPARRRPRGGAGPAATTCARRCSASSPRSASTTRSRCASAAGWRRRCTELLPVGLRRKPETPGPLLGPRGDAYSRRAALLSLGQEPRWHRYPRAPPRGGPRRPRPRRLRPARAPSPSAWCWRAAAGSPASTRAPHMLAAAAGRAARRPASPSASRWCRARPSASPSTTPAFDGAHRHATCCATLTIRRPRFASWCGSCARGHAREPGVRRAAPGPPAGGLAALHRGGAPAAGPRRRRVAAVARRPLPARQHPRPLPAATRCRRCSTCTAPPASRACASGASASAAGW